MESKHGIPYYPTMDFAINYYDNHVFLSANNMAVKYDNTPRGYKPPKRLTYIFGQILGKMRKEGLVEKYSSNTYKKIGN